MKTLLILGFILVISNFNVCMADQQHFAATPLETLKVYNCTKLPSIKEMQSELSQIYSNRSSRVDTFNLDGFIFNNASIAEIKDLNALTTDRPLIGEAKNLIVSNLELIEKEKTRLPDKIDTKNGRTFNLNIYQKKNPSCHDILCAMKSIFGPERGIEILWAYKKYGLDLSRYQFVHGIDFDREELESAIRAISILPEHLRPTITDEDKGFFRFKKGYTMGLGGGPGVIANAFGAIFDPIDDYGAAFKIYIFAHEMGHRSARFKEMTEEGDVFPRSLDSTSSWLKISGWKVSGKTDNKYAEDYYTHVGGGLISGYAGTSPAEDFAETFAAYRFSPAKLKKMSPARYQFMRANIFMGIEYTDDICQGSKSNLDTHESANHTIETKN